MKETDQNLQKRCYKTTKIPPEDLWAFQLKLLKKAESMLGPRDSSKEVCPPRFFDRDIPTIRFTQTQVGVYLTRKAECNRDIAVFQMAHETVHLLNPVPRKESNYLEEGVAVAFSLYVLPFLGISDRYQKEVESFLPEEYKNALDLVKKLPYEPLKAGRLIRERIEKLSAATIQDPEKHLEKLFPSVAKTTLSELAEKFHSGHVESGF